MGTKQKFCSPAEYSNDSYFLLLFVVTTRIRTIFYFFGRNDKEELGCFWRHREKLRCHTLPCFFLAPLPPPPTHPVPNNVATFLPAKRTTTTQFVLSYLPFFPFPSRYLRLADFFAMFWSVVASSTLVAFFPPSNWLTAIFFLAGCVSLPISWGSS